MAKTPQRRDIMEVRDTNKIAALNDLCRTAMGILEAYAEYEDAAERATA